VIIEWPIRDVEELERGIAVKLWIYLAEVADRPGLIAWSNPVPQYILRRSRDSSRFLQPLSAIPLF
jgi:hypothetical protein